MAPHNCNYRPSFVLLMVLVVLVILMTLTAALAWTVSTRSLSVDSRVSCRQNHYALIAAVKVIGQKLQRGELMLQIQDKGTADGTIRLGTAQVYYRVWDEAAKYKFTRGSSKMLPDFLKDLEVRIRTYDEKSKIDGELFLFEDVFSVEMKELRQIYGPVSEGKALVDLVTLWSDGRVNINTASDEALSLKLQDLHKETFERLLQLRRGRHIDSIEQLALRLRLSRRDRQILLTRLITRSNLMTIRLICQGQMLRSDAFAVVQFQEQGPVVRLWRDLPAIGEVPEQQVAKGT